MDLAAVTLSRTAESQVTQLQATTDITNMQIRHTERDQRLHIWEPFDLKLASSASLQNNTKGHLPVLVWC